MNYIFCVRWDEDYSIPKEKIWENMPPSICLMIKIAYHTMNSASKKISTIDELQRWASEFYGAQSISDLLTWKNKSTEQYLRLIDKIKNQYEIYLFENTSIDFEKLQDDNYFIIERVE